MEGSVLSKVILPIALAVVMLGLGLSLTLKDFARFKDNRRPVIVGILLQMLVLPAVGFGIVKAFALPPELAVGIMILALCPGGTTSNVISHLARGDLALSVTLTALVSIITPISIPLMTQWSMGQLMGETATVEGVGKQILMGLVAISLVPIALGMLVKAKKPSFADRAEPWVRRLSLFLLVAIILGLVKKEWDNLPTFFAQVGLAAFALNALTMAIGFFGGKAVKLPRKQAITIGIEVGVQNGTVALFITGAVLENSTMSIAPAVYSVIMFGTAFLFAVLVNQGKHEHHEAETPASPGG